MLSREISAYFKNKALGMSMEYGLRGSLIGISEIFGYLLQQRQINNENIYTGIVFIDNTGKLLVENYLKYNKPRQVQNWEELLTLKSSEVSIILKKNRQVLQIIISAPYFFKNKYAGQTTVAVIRQKYQKLE
mgnify:CR=1 FL=1